MKKTIFIKNAAILTVSSLVLRFAGIIFKVWLAARIGAEGIGLYQLVFSVYMFIATFATSGICTAVTRLVSEELVVGNKQGVRRILFRSIELSLAIAAASIIILFFGANFISDNILHDARAAISLKILAFSLPFMGICSCIKGYFMARRKATPASSSQLLEQVVRIAVVMFIIGRYKDLTLEYACASVYVGDTLAEAVSCLYVYIRYRIDFKRLTLPHAATRKPYKLFPIISHIALPISAGRYLNSLLRMIENILVPICLSQASLSADGISLFGMIKGMALPLLFFPSTLLGALSTLLLPEMSEAAVRGRKAVVRIISYRIIKITGLIAIIFSALFFVAGDRIGFLIYKSNEVGFLLRALSPIIPFMYLDAICDGILKGLDQQKFTFYTSVGDSVIRIVLILLFLKQWGIFGFIGIMYFSNFLTGTLNVWRLIKVSGLRPNLMQNFILPCLGAYAVCISANAIMSSLLKMPDLLYVLTICVFGITFYIMYLFMLKIIDIDDINFIRQK